METYFVKDYNLPVCKYRGKMENIKYPCYASIKFDGELTYIINLDNECFTVNKDKYGRIRKNYPVTEEFKKLNLPKGIYLGELFWNEGRTKEDFYGFLSHKTDDNLNLAIWGTLQLKDKIDISTEDTYNFLEKIPNQEHVIVAPYIKLYNESELKLFAESIIDSGYEGVVIRNMDAVYRNGQSVKWTKIKKKAREIEEKTKNGAKINFKLEKYGVWL